MPPSGRHFLLLVDQHGKRGKTVVTFLVHCRRVQHHQRCYNLVCVVEGDGEMKWAVFVGISLAAEELRLEPRGFARRAFFQIACCPECKSSWSFLGDAFRYWILQARFRCTLQVPIDTVGSVPEKERIW